MNLRQTFRLTLLTLLVASSSSLLADDVAAPSAPDRAALEKKFEETMSHARLVGFFTASDHEGPPKHDAYTLGAVTKGEGDKWIFNAAFKFGKQTLNLPLAIPVLWAGDTPVISVTDFSIPAMGTFTARVMIYGDQYVGTWSSPVHNGMMWGKIEHAPTTEPAEKKE